VFCRLKIVGDVEIGDVELVSEPHHEVEYRGPDRDIKHLHRLVSYNDVSNEVDAVARAGHRKE
jgi:hypothetical protein